MATLKLKRPIGGTKHWAALAAQHRDARLYRHNRFVQRNAQLEEDGYCDVIKDRMGRWVDVFGEFSHYPADCY